MEQVSSLLPNDHNGSNDDHLSAALLKRFGPVRDYRERPHLTLQLGTDDPSRLHECVSRILAEGYSFREINLNCGCPGVESGGASGYGASLMRRGGLTGDLVRAAKDAVDSFAVADGDGKTTVSVKCRIAVLDTPDQISSEEPLSDHHYRKLHRYVRTVEDAGADHVILHARPAILSGLSPTKNRTVPPLDRSFVRRIAADFPSLRTTTNGGIDGMDSLRALREGDGGG